MAIAQFKNLTYQYQEETLDINTLNEINLSEAKETLFKTKEIFDECKIEFCLAFGTLLGAIREKNFIEGDLDIDIYVENEEELFKKLPYLESKGLKLIRAIPHEVYSFRLNKGCYIDVYIFRKLGFSFWGLYCYGLAENYNPKKYFKGKEEIEFLGKKFKCPRKPERLLKFWYGKTWKTPISKSEVYYHCDDHFHHFWKFTFRPSVKKIIIKIIGERMLNKLRNK